MQHLRGTKTQRIERLILRRPRHMFHRRQMTQKRHNFRCAHLARMLPASASVPMKLEEPRRPLHVSLLGAQRIMFQPQHLAQLIEQFGLGIGNDERSLCRTRVEIHSPPKLNKHSLERNQNPAMARRGSAAFSPPNTWLGITAHVP